MTTPAQIAANRRNALKSTGPRTAAGKAASSRNGLRHGLTSRRAVVRGEDAQDFERFRAELRSALAPRDAREEVLAETVVQAAWRQRRAWRAEAALFKRGPRIPPLRELMILKRYEAAADRAFYRALTLLERGRAAALRTPQGNRHGVTTPCPAARNSGFCQGHPIFACPAGAEALGALGVLAVRSGWLAFAETRRKPRKTAKNHLRMAGIATNSARPAARPDHSGWARGVDKAALLRKRKCLRARWVVSAGSACPREPWVPPSAWIRATSGAPHTPG